MVFECIFWTVYVFMLAVIALGTRLVLGVIQGSYGRLALRIGTSAVTAALFLLVAPMFLWFVLVQYVLDATTHGICAMLFRQLAVLVSGMITLAIIWWPQVQKTALKES